MAVLKAAFGDTPIMIEYDDFIKNLGHFKKKKKSHPTILLSCALSLNSELHAVTLIEGYVQGAWTAHCQLDYHVEDTQLRVTIVEGTKCSKASNTTHNTRQ